MMRGRNAFTACITLVLGVMMLTTTGCGRRARSATVNDARMARYTERLIRIAARDTGCHAGQLSPVQITSQPAVFTVTGCDVPVEYWLECGRRRCRWRSIPKLNEAAAQSMQCPPHAIQQQPSQAPNVRYASGCGRMQPFAITCNAAACGWAPSGPAQLLAQHAPPPAPMPPPVSSAPPQVEAQPQEAHPIEALIQDQVRAQREAILSCVDSPSLVLRMRWTADGQVIVQMPQELLGTAADACLQALLGGMRVAAQGAGEIVIPLQ